LRDKTRKPGTAPTRPEIVAHVIDKTCQPPADLRNDVGTDGSMLD